MYPVAKLWAVAMAVLMIQKLERWTYGQIETFPIFDARIGVSFVGVNFWQNLKPNEVQAM